MSPAQATAKIFVTAFKALPPGTRDRVVLEILRDRSLREDLLDLAIAEERIKEPSKPLKRFLSETGAKRAP